jgi:hypothetical protein
MSDIVSTPPGRSTRRASAKNTARDEKWKAASTLITPSNVAAEREPGRVGVHAMGAGLGQTRLPRKELRERDVHRDERAGLRGLGDHRVLLAQAVPDIEHVAADRQRTGDRLDQSANGHGGLVGVAAVALPQPEVQPSGSQRDEEVGAEAVVHGGGGVPPVPEHRQGVTEVLARPPDRSHAGLRPPSSTPTATRRGA